MLKGKFSLKELIDEWEALEKQAKEIVEVERELDKEKNDQISISDLYKEYEAINRLSGVVIPKETVDRYHAAAHVVFKHSVKRALENLEARANQILQDQENASKLGVTVCGCLSCRVSAEITQIMQAYFDRMYKEHHQGKVIVK